MNERGKNHDELFPGHASTLKVTDPELIEVFDNFAFDEVLRYSSLDTRTRLMVQLASLIACQGLAERGIALPLEGQSTTTPDSREAKGLALQKGIFGADLIERMYASAPEDELHFQRLLSANCFGDHVARRGLDVRMRELLSVITHVLPFIGYPRTLNALAAINDVTRPRA